MKSILLKFQKIYFPLLLSQLILIVAYSTFHGLVLSLHLKNSLLEFFLPIIIAGLISWFVCRPRFRLLKFNEKTTDFFTLFSWPILAIPLMISQIYIENKTAIITEIKTVSNINLNKTTELYSIQNAFADKENYRMWSERKVSGRNQEKLIITSYFICPLIDSINHLTSNFKNNQVWIGQSFSKAFSNRVFENQEKQNNDINNFIISTQKLYKEHQFQTIYLRNLITDDDFNSYFFILKSRRPEIKKQDVLILKEEKTTVKNKSVDNITWFFRTFIGGNLIWLVFIAFAGIDKKELTKFNKKQNEPFFGKKNVQNLVWLQTFWGTSILISTNLFVYIIMYFSDLNFNNSNELLRWGAANDRLIMNGEWWRLATSIFVHGGLIHLIYNMVILAFMGCLIESILGAKKYLILYLSCGISASLVTLFFKSNFVEVGASGAIFGLCGIYYGLTLIHYIERNFFIGLISIFVLLNILFSFKSGVSMSAHLGGLISGFIIAIIYFPFEKYLISKR